MVILEDTRQQDSKHMMKQKWFKQHGIIVRRCRLYVGDYTLASNQSICIDTKRNMQEICGNLTNDHARVAAEADRAKEAGIRLIYLIENDGGEVKKNSGIYNKVIRDISEVHSWKNPRLFIMGRNGKQKYPRATKGITLQKIMMKFAEDHGCEFVFCRSSEAAEMIVRLLSDGRTTEETE